MRALLALALLPALAHAGDAISVEYDATVGIGQTPELRVIAAEALRAVTVDLSCGGSPIRWTNPIAAGETAAIPLPSAARPGRHHCAGSLSIIAQTGATGAMSLSFDVAVLGGLDLDAAYEDIDLPGGMVTVHASRPLVEVTVQAIGVDGAVVGRGSAHPNHADPRIQWFPNSVEVVRLEIEGRDADGVGASLTLIPWSYAIPHEDLVFDTNEHAIRPEEEPKLEEAYADLQRVLARYGSVVDVKLYVGGYTDTVGDPSANLALSGRRARAIAEWFRRRGFSGPVSWQGFGEGVLRVPTGDGVDEVRNRRAVYVLSANPPVGDDFPAQRWNALP
jgi:hypothetical protein